MIRLHALALAGLTLIVCNVATSAATQSGDDTTLTGREIMKAVVERPEGEHLRREMTIKLIDSTGTERVQETHVFRKRFGPEKRLAVYYTAPTTVADTAFLTYDYADPSVDDDQWLYLPALRKVRRISASDRGDFFLGTDFTYEEIKKDNKIELADYNYQRIGTERIRDVTTYKVEGVPKTEQIAAELGYRRVVWYVDPKRDVFLRSEFWDTNGNHARTLRNTQIKRVDGIVTVLRATAKNHKTGHKTVLVFQENDYESSIPDYVFERRMLRRGL